VSTVSWKEMGWADLSDHHDDPYRRLGVPRDATAHEVRAAYRRLAHALHPDRHPEAKRALMEELMKRINIAYDLISGNDRDRTGDPRSEGKT
jgi:curved DNA-binding protein CbpA